MLKLFLSTFFNKVMVKMGDMLVILAKMALIQALCIVI
jgi:hypothetical protein